MFHESVLKKEAGETQNNGEALLLLVWGAQCDWGLGVSGVNPDKQGKRSRSDRNRLLN